MEALVKIAMTGKTDSARVAASIAILDRAFGRPRQTLQAESKSNVQYFITDKPLTARTLNHARLTASRISVAQSLRL
jgi:hypothetical protein